MASQQSGADSSIEDHFPVKNPWRSLSAVLFVQAQNAFNDNFLKFVLISLAGVAAAGDWFGNNSQRVLASFIPLAFILFSPLAGYLSDRYSKRNVIFVCVVAQFIILGLTVLGLSVRSLTLVVLCLFLLSVQSTFFSPAKQGILKELVGSKKLAMANGIMTMLTTLAILAGAGLGGSWFGNRYNASADEWQAAIVPVLAVSTVALVPLLLKLFVNPTPEHISTKFEPAILVRHFGYLKDLFGGHTMRITAIGITFYWFIASFVGVVIFDFGKLTHPDSLGDAAKESSRLILSIGAGVMVGSIFVAVLSRNGIRLGFVLIGGIGLALGLAGTGLFSPGTAFFYGSMVVVGFFGAAFVVPLTAFLQDIAPNERRGRIMGASALSTSISGLLAILISLAFTQCKISLGIQMLSFVIPTLLVTWYVSKLIKLHRPEV